MALLRDSLRVEEQTFVIQEVTDKRTEELFLKVPNVIYIDDPYWIPPIREEIKGIFNPFKNPYFKQGAAKRWILIGRTGKMIGRISAFVNFEKINDADKKVGCIGFFECIDNRQAAFMLFDHAIHWLVDNFKVDVIDGPVNFGENDKYWGLLIKGFGSTSYGMNYNPLYYRHLFESYGFAIQYKQLTNHIDLHKPLPERFVKIAERVSRHTHYTFQHFRYSERSRFIDDFVTIYNQAWASFKNFKPMDKAIVRNSIEEMKPVLEEKFIWFAYVEGKPAGLLVGTPDVNEILKYVDGEFTWLNKLKFLFYKYYKGFTCARVVVMGIVPEYQRHGLESALILHAYEAGQKKRRYKHVQLAWVGDFNSKMIAIHQAMGAVEDKQHATYRKVLQ